MSDDKDHEWLFDELAAEKAAHLATRQELSRALAERMEAAWLASETLDNVSRAADELERERDEARAEVENWEKAASVLPGCDTPRSPQDLMDVSDTLEWHKAEVERLRAVLHCPDETYDHVHRCERCDSEVAS